MPIIRSPSNCLSSLRFRVNVKVDVFLPGNMSISTFTRNKGLQRQFEGALDDGHNGARNMLSNIYVTK
jgi:hypothetical protein